MVSEKVRRVQNLRRSNAAGFHKGKRKNRSEEKRRAIQEARYER